MKYTKEQKEKSDELLAKCFYGNSFDAARASSELLKLTEKWEREYKESVLERFSEKFNHLSKNRVVAALDRWNELFGDDLEISFEIRKIK